ncbi:YolD-like family protein [Thermoactinomyces intermedius]|uniref:YolD-like family protein n=1 Tax=Thermoactinomyces intermedius TaxID=2024 RepID=A0A8I1A944_THEIN|nr:YolD-like family protein [Thermoactinomyces intermedius]MBA4548028.1 YolD-like family protein [Thermoactinomyces intermedius]MBA4836336.1 YolD-like family protein [Thermoactinomyces intermedius]MBH8593741.1 YolD-like family protein [Thermoactinomyces intermedius]
MSSVLNRKNLLWEGSRMFLPEHREALFARRKRQEEWSPPELAEDALEEINQILLEALHGDFPVLVRYVKNRHPCQLCGFVEKLNPQERRMKIANGRYEEIIPFSAIYSVQKVSGHP